MDVRRFLCLGLGFLWGFQVFAGCRIYATEGNSLPLLHDKFSQLIIREDACPSNAKELRRLLKNNHLATTPYMIANEGRQEAGSSSYSIFETHHDELYIGHFTTGAGEQIKLDDSNEGGKLIVELIAWDHLKQFYNFYELRGLKAENSRWYYRGDSKDIILDNAQLYRQQPPQFGERLRCSACHISGGPIMKELNYPYNDWHRKGRPLAFSKRLLEKDLKELSHELGEPREFARMVRSGVRRLQNSPRYQTLGRVMSMQTRLRPLFCTQEVNLIANRSDDSDKILIDSSYFVNPLLLKKQKISIDSKKYQQALVRHRLHFSHSIDADNAWLAPVKGYNDMMAIQQLLSQGVVDNRFVMSVLSIDVAHPLFSERRCRLLRYLPDSSDRWEEVFLENLAAVTSRSEDKAASLKLVSYLTSPRYSPRILRTIAEVYLDEILYKLNSEEGFDALFQTLLTKRRAVHFADISLNPKGEILEPGFRRIFPESSLS